MSQIVFKNVSKLYGQEAALRHVDLEFVDGVTTAIVGPSGSGKSTLLQLINALVQPSSGSLQLFGKQISYGQLPELRRKIGYAVQGTGLFPHLNVEKNITLLARLVGWEAQRIHKRLQELMGLVGLPEEYAKRYPHELSGGQQQRVGLCRAMMLNPPIFLLDEPFGALDSITRQEIHREFLCLQASEPRTMVLVTHDLREATKLAQQLIILERGRVVQHASKEETLKTPVNDFVRSFLHEHLEA